MARAELTAAEVARALPAGWVLSSLPAWAAVRRADGAMVQGVTAIDLMGAVLAAERTRPVVVDHDAALWNDVEDLVAPERPLCAEAA
jgi:hypothetical protein